MSLTRQGLLIVKENGKTIEKSNDNKITGFQEDKR